MVWFRGSGASCSYCHASSLQRYRFSSVCLVYLGSPAVRSRYYRLTLCSPADYLFGRAPTACSPAHGCAITLPLVRHGSCVLAWHTCAVGHSRIFCVRTPPTPAVRCRLQFYRLCHTLVRFGLVRLGWIPAVRAARCGHTLPPTPLPHASPTFTPSTPLPHIPAYSLFIQLDVGHLFCCPLFLILPLLCRFCTYVVHFTCATLLLRLLLPLRFYTLPAHRSLPSHICPGFCLDSPHYIPVHHIWIPRILLLPHARYYIVVHLHYHFPTLPPSPYLPPALLDLHHIHIPFTLGFVLLPFVVWYYTCHFTCSLLIGIPLHHIPHSR